MVDYLAIIPEISLVVLSAILLAVDLMLSEERKGLLNPFSLAGLLLVLVITAIFGQPGASETAIWGGMLRHDWLAYVFRLVFISGALLTVVFARNWPAIGKRGEFYLMLVFSTLGMTLMSASGDLVMLFLAIETASIPQYVMAGFMGEDKKSTEAGFKYLLFGAMTSAVMLYGFSLLYGFSGTTDLYAIAQNVVSDGVPAIPLVASLLLVLVGFAFKISMFPFHFWAPDVYEGAPTPVTGFLSTASKAAGFSVLVRVMFVVFPEITAQWQQILAVLSFITMTLGNLVAMRQTNIKRMLAYSSIAHAGYILIGVASASEFGLMGVVYYLVVYLLSNLAAFGFVVVYTNSTGKEDILDYAGLSRRNAGMAFGMVFIMLSLGGIPPLGGFFGKVLLFAAAVKSGLVWLAVVGVLNSVVGLYYYLTVLKVVYLYRQDGDEIPLAMPPIQAVTLTALVAGVTLLGVVLAPMFKWATTAAAALF